MTPRGATPSPDPQTLLRNHVVEFSSGRSGHLDRNSNQVRIVGIADGPAMIDVHRRGIPGNGVPMVVSIPIVGGEGQIERLILGSVHGERQRMEDRNWEMGS